MTPAILHSTGSKRAGQESAGSWLPVGRRSTTEVSRKTGCKTAITPGGKQVFETSRTAIASKKQAHLLDRTVFGAGSVSVPLVLGVRTEGCPRQTQSASTGRQRKIAQANRMGQSWGTVRAAFAYTEIGEIWSTRLT